jgi:uncharacterized protein (DUF3084 family)
VGKARLSLFNLRPRRTATLITILTGSIISASTFAFLFAVSDELRKGVFEYQKTQRALETARQELEQVADEKEEIEDELASSRQEQMTAQQRLEEINRSLQASIERQRQTEAALNRTQAQIQQIQERYQQAQSMLATVTGQAANLRSEIQQLQADRQELIRQRDEVRQQIAQRDQEIAQRDQAIAERVSQLQELEGQYIDLSKKVQNLEREFQALRQGNVALLRNQTLASGVVRVLSPNAAPQAIEQLLQQANSIATQRVLPEAKEVGEQVIQITNAEVERVIEQIQDGQDYVIRVQSSGNYVVGEPCVLAGEACINVFVTTAQNQLVFRQGDVVASTTVHPAAMNNQELAERILLLIAAAQFRARQAGIFAEAIQISDNRRETALEFINRVRQYGQPLEIQAVSAQDSYTAGIRLELRAVKDGQVLFGTPSQL